MKSESVRNSVCLTLCGPMDCGPPLSAVHGILQKRILEWVAIPFSRGSSQPKDLTQVSCIAGRFFTIWATREACCCCCWVTSVVSDSVRPHGQQPTRLLCPWDFSGKSTGVGCHRLLRISCHSWCNCSLSPVRCWIFSHPALQKLLSSLLHVHLSFYSTPPKKQLFFHQNKLFEH